jgi:NAD(P)-dependent dehydrogenase (short-subunit alcohol dehydrogenase family)
MRVDRRQFLKLTGASVAMPAIPGCGGHERIPVEGVPRSNFDEDSTAEEVTEGMDLNGKIAVVTGCDKAQAACSSVIGKTTPVALELSDFDSVVACAETIRSIKAPIDMLICNAGMRGSRKREQVYGLEKHFVVNHLGHFILVYNLLERLYLSWQGRVVVVGSRAAYGSAPQEGIEFGNLRGAANYSRSRAYGHSKLANVLFSLELARLLKGTRITSNSLHPGVINTEIDRTEPGLFQLAFGVLTAVGGKSIAQGAATSCYVATSPQLGAISGQYFEDCNAVTVLGDNHMHDAMQAEQLWQVSETLTKDYLDELQAPETS